MIEQPNTTNNQSKLGWRRLSVTMGFQMLLVALLPLIIIAVVVLISLGRSISDLEQGIVSTRQQMAQEVVGANLQNEAQVTMEAIDEYMRERFQDALGWANTPIVRQAAQAAAARAEELELTTLSESQIETKMEATRALNRDTELTTYLKGLVARNPAFTEIFFTDSNGFTVAYSNKPSDFVQAGETWWDAAWSQGSYVGNVEYDDSAGVYSVEVVMRINASSGEPVGVLKAVLDVQAIQQLATSAASRVNGSALHIFTPAGYQIADTTSQHDPAVIMTDQGNLLQQDWPVARTIIEQTGADRNGYQLQVQNLSGQPVVAGYASSAPGSYYGIPGFDGFNWNVTIDQPEEIALASLQGLDDVLSQMDDTQRSIMVLTIIVGIVTAIAAVAAALWASRRIVRPIVNLAQPSQRSSDSELDTPIDITQSNEIGQLESAFLQMTAQLRQTLQNEREQREYLQEMIAQYMTFVASVARGDLTTRLTLSGNGQENDPLTVLGHNLNEIDRKSVV